MKLYDINKIYPVNLKNILCNCKITEKFDTHYVKLKIINSNKVICCKASGQPITQEDIILNKMWGYFVSDFVFLESQQEFKDMIKHYIGTTIGIFYFPCHKPINVKYMFATKRFYLVHQIYDVYNKCEIILDYFNDFINTYKFNNNFDISINEYINLSDSMITDIIDNQKLSLSNYQLLHNKKIHTLDIDDVEYVIKSENNKFYQLSNQKNYNILPSFTERASFEFVLCDFIKFFNNEKIVESLKGSYKNIVCQCFNKYIEHEKRTKYIEHNIDPESLQPPHVGYDHGDNICSPYITNQYTIDLCNESLLYRNIFKILLVNLKSIKKKKYVVYMNDKQVNDMNNIVKTIKFLKSETNYG